MKTKLTKAALRKLADKAGISIGAGDNSPYPTLEQLDAFAQAVRAQCADQCRAIGMVHNQQPDRFSAGKKAGAFECADALSR